MDYIFSTITPKQLDIPIRGSYFLVLHITHLGILKKLTFYLLEEHVEAMLGIQILQYRNSTFCWWFTQLTFYDCLGFNNHTFFWRQLVHYLGFINHTFIRRHRRFLAQQLLIKLVYGLYVTIRTYAIVIIKRHHLVQYKLAECIKFFLNLPKKLYQKIACKPPVKLVVPTILTILMKPYLIDIFHIFGSIKLLYG
jgi:hypothetical protein